MDVNLQTLSAWFVPRVATWDGTINSRQTLLRPDPSRWAIFFPGGWGKITSFAFNDGINDAVMTFPANSAPYLMYFTQVGSLVCGQWDMASQGVPLANPAIVEILYRPPYSLAEGPPPQTIREGA